MAGASMSNKQIYHEKQVRELCALHALNNLFQDSQAFTKSKLDEICFSLTSNYWLNPHKSILGLGNYDVNVLISALQSKGYDLIWFDKRKDPFCLNLNNITGFILNISTDYKFSVITIPWKRRHWIAIRNINGIYYNLDSKSDEPQMIGQENDLKQFIRGELDSKDVELFIVVTKEIAEKQGWIKLESQNTNNIRT